MDRDKEFSSKPKLLLINPPVYDFALYDLFLQPYGLLRIGAWLEREGYSVSLLDCLDISDPYSLRVYGAPRRRENGTGKFFRKPVPYPSLEKSVPRRFARYGIDPVSITREIERVKPDLVMVTSGMTYWYHGVVEICNTLRKTLPGVPVIIGGIYASLMPEHCEASTGAITAPGPAEESLPPLLSRLGFPQAKGSISTRDMLPHVALQRGSAVLRLSQGCPFRCRYCASRAITSGFSLGRAEDLLNQYAGFHSLGIRNFAFYDDALLFRKEDALAPFLKGVIESGLRGSFYMPNAVHVAYLDEETADLLYKAGFKEARLGFESLLPGFHEELGEKYNQGIMREAVENLKRAGFSGREIFLYVLAGLPGQPYQEVEDSVRFCLDLGVRPVVAEYSPVPGSSLWDTCLSSTDLPLAREPLYHNNSLFPLEWEGFTRENLNALKELSLKPFLQNHQS